jgi:hypothetical protein
MTVKSIAGRWEISQDSKTLELDFDFTYIRAG